MSSLNEPNARPLRQGIFPRLVFLLGLPLAYAVIRYHVLQEVAWAQFPLFVGNKAVSLAAVFFIAASYLVRRAPGLSQPSAGRRLVLGKSLGLTGFSLASLHALMGLLMMSPAYYPKLYGPDDRMNLTGELSFLLGVLAFWCLAVTAVTSLPFMVEALGPDRWLRGQQMGYAGLGLVAGHVIVMGLSGWMRPSAWPGWLPPVSLVAFGVAVTPLLAKLRRL